MVLLRGRCCQESARASAHAFLVAVGAGNPRTPARYPVYRFRTRHRYCDLRLGRMNRLRQIAVCVPPPALPVHDPGLRLAGAAGPQRGVQGCGDHDPPSGRARSGSHAWRARAPASDPRRRSGRPHRTGRPRGKPDAAPPSRPATATQLPGPVAHRQHHAGPPPSQTRPPRYDLGNVPFLHICAPDNPVASITTGVTPWQTSQSRSSSNDGVSVA